MEREGLHDRVLPLVDVERADQFDPGAGRGVDCLVEQVAGRKLGVVLGNVEDGLDPLVREVDANLHRPEPVADVRVEPDQAGAFGQGDVHGLRACGAAALQGDLAAGPRALYPELDLVLGLGKEQAETRAVADLDPRVVVRTSPVLDDEFDLRARPEPFTGAVREQHRVVAAQPLAEELRAGGRGAHPGRLGFVLVAEGVVGHLDLDFELLGLRVVGLVDPGRHPVDDARVLGPELVAGDPAVLLELDGEHLAVRGSLLPGRDDRLGRGLEHHVRVAEHPLLLRELQGRRQVAPGALGSAALHPGDEDVDLLLAHPPGVPEVVVAGVGGPRRHAPGHQLFFDRHRPGAGAGLRVVAVGGQVDVVRGRALRVVARHAVAAEDRPDVVGEVDVGRDPHVGRGRVGGDAGQGQGGQRDRGHGGGEALAVSHRPSPE